MIREAGPQDVALVNSILGTDVSAFMAEPAHVALLNDNTDAALFAFRGPGIYEVHIGFEARGSDALKIGRAMLDHMKARGGRYFWSQIPPDSRKVQFYARLMGWKHQGTIPTNAGPYELYISKEIPCLQS